jgi:hypothetical protein
MYEGSSVTESLSHGSEQEGLVNQEHIWLDDDVQSRLTLSHQEVWQEVPEQDTDIPSSSNE